MIGETEPVPFVAAFVNDKLPTSTREAIQAALFDVGHHPKLCKALETKAGFVASSQDGASANVAAKKN